MYRALAIATLCLVTCAAQAQELVGCDKFKWPLDAEHAALARADLPRLASGADVAQPPAAGIVIALVSLQDSRLPMPPERAPKQASSFAGFVKIGAPTAGTYRISLSAEAWIDVIQGGHYVKSSAFSGATGCPGLRKSVKFGLTAEPFVVQLSGVPAETIAIVVTND